MISSRIRTVLHNKVVLDQAEFLTGDEYTRVAGLTSSNLNLKAFFNNVLQPWSLVAGSSVSDNLIKSGSVYWSEIPGAPGYYNVRFRPNAIGHWRLALNYDVGTQSVILGFDVVEQPPSIDNGLTASFVKPV